MVYVAASLLGMIPGVNGNGTLASISFQAFDNSSITLREPILLDSQLNDILFQTVHGSVIVLKENLFVSSIIPNKHVVCQNLPMNITVTVENQGESSQTFNVILYLNSTVICTKQATNLPPNSNFTFTYTWTASGFSVGNYTLNATADHVQGEWDYNDNTLAASTVAIAIPGDIAGPNGWPDGQVDIRDVSTTAQRFGSNLGQTKYLAECDFNNDGKIDIRDVGIAARNFGQHYP
jgi:hypothetical protein